MKKTTAKKVLSIMSCIVLTAAAALTTACTKEEQSAPAQTSAAQSSAPAELGEGQNSFDFTVTDKDGNSTAYIIRTDKTIVGEALQELGLISGDEGEFGLYVKTVNGITADYDIDGTYWAFYINDEYAVTGVDATEITAGDVYSFRIEG